jgi:hypothetical protein
MTRRNFALCVVALSFMVVGVVRAEDKKEEKKQPYEGTWKWTVTFNNNTREQTMVLKTADGKPAGHIVGRNNTELKIEDATFKDGTLGFTVSRTAQDGNKIVSKYSGKVEGDTIKGKIDTERNGETNTRDWEAKREKAEKPAA